MVLRDLQGDVIGLQLAKNCEYMQQQTVGGDNPLFN